MFGFLEIWLFLSNFYAIIFWGEKRTLLAGQMGFKTFKVR